MRSAAHLTKNNRTLLWYKPTLTGDIHRWRRWSVLVTESESLKAIQPDLVFLYDKPTAPEIAAWSNWFSAPTQQSLALLTPEWMIALKLNAAENPSLLVTSELSQRYPYLPPLTTEDSKEDWIMSLAQLMRFHKIITPTSLPNKQTIFTGTIQQIDPAANANKVVPAVYLIQQYYVPARAQRHREIKLALQKNIECPLIDKIILLNETKCELPTSDKIQQIVIGHRLTYMDVFMHIKTHVPMDTIVVFSNSDIYVDETLRQLYSVDLDKKFLALLRYDVSEKGDEPKLFGPRPDSQDTWVVWSTSVDFALTTEDFDFNFGIPGCDNTITVTMLRKKFTVVNPALSIRTYHLHSSNIRNYNPADVIDKPVFLYVEPTGIQEYGTIMDIDKNQVKTWQRTPPRSFACPIKHVDERTAETICNMMKRESHYKYSTKSTNVFNQGYEDEDNKLYKFEGTYFTMPSGLVCDYKNLILGKHRIWREEWSNVPITVLTNTVAVPAIAAVHFPVHYNMSAAKWFLHYLPNVLKIRALAPKPTPEFIVPVHPDTQRALQILKWPEEGTVTIIPYLQDCQYVSQTVYALTPNSFHDPPAEHIDFLRTMVPKPPKSPHPIVVIVAERNADKQLSRLFAEELKKNIFERSDNGKWITQIIDADTQTEVRLSLLMRADLVIAHNDSEWDALDWMWLMKPNATVIDVMLDTAPRGEHIHLAGAASINYVLMGVKREPLPYQRQHILEDVEKVLKQHMFKDVLKAAVPEEAIPVVIVPTGKALTGIHEHAGDTFREMVDIWSERGYIRLVKSEETPYCWWNAIGDTLLYDRPTMRWFNSPSYKLALFGNSSPEKPTKRDRSWSFWPRSPRAVERLVEAKANNKTYGERHTPSIFLGRIENGVQQERRTKYDWSTAVHTFHCPKDSTGGPYTYSQEEYLNMLTGSRFGLCLPGYGPKCNREIEYFATGVVPIVTPGVDMKNYFMAPQKDVHYFVANTPEEVIAIVENTTEQQWSTMSEAGKQWWQRYASAEGLFRFTWGIHQKFNE